VGPLAAEVIGTLIPNQRVDRLEGLFQKIEEKLSGLPREHWESRFQTPEFIDLLEDGMYQAAHALSDLRREHIAALLKNSLTRDDLDQLQQKRLLGILGQLNDAEVLILHGDAMPNMQRRDDFTRAHWDVIVGPQPTLSSGQDVVDQGAVHKTYVRRLVDLGLVRVRYRRPWNSSEPWEFDSDTGMLKAEGRAITALGRLLLRYIDHEPTP
jgi:hypothetical protein